MGKLEEQNKKSLRRTQVQEAVLETISIAGVIGIGLLTPNGLKALHQIGFLDHPQQSGVVRSAASRLKKRGFLEFKNGHYSITPAGEKVLRYWQLSDYKIPQPKKWDRKWRMIIFDIPEKRKFARREVNRIFTHAGFYRLQDSVWVYPYDCEDVIGLIKSKLGIGRDLLYVIVEQIENDKHIKQEFGLM